MKKFGIIGLSSPLKSETVEQCKSNLTSNNIKIEIFGSLSKNYNSYEDLFFSADSIENRIQALSSIENVDLVMAARGGYGCIELLPYVKQITENIFVGYSDFTAFLNQSERLGFKAIHGISFGNFSIFEEEQLKSLNKLIELLDTQKLEYSGLTHFCGDFSSNGYVFGGNLSVLTALLGTPYFPEFKNKILFLEETGERPYKIHRMLKQLELAGVLSKLNGIILGDFRNCNHEYPPNIEHVFLDIFKKYDYPVYSGLSSGHSKLNLPVPFYLPAKLGKELIFG